MKIFVLLFMVASCTSQVREVNQQCEVTCSKCTGLKIKCDTINKKDNKDLGQ